MVEFGLKLDDNKVSEWNEHYIQYEKLKSILVRASTSVKKLEEYKTKRPESTAALIQAYKSGMATPFQSTVDLVGQDTSMATTYSASTGSIAPPTTTSTSTTTTIASSETIIMVGDSTSSAATRANPLTTITEEKQNSFPEPSVTTTSTPSRSNNNNNNNNKHPYDTIHGTTAITTPTNYGSVTPVTPISPTTSVVTPVDASFPASPYSSNDSNYNNNNNNNTNSNSRRNLLSRAFDKASSGVSDYLQRTYERNVWDCLKEIDTIALEFDEAIQENIQRVNQFYHVQLQELKGRIEYLKESVAIVRRPSSSSINVPPPLDEDHPHVISHVNTTADTDENDDRKETPLVKHRKSLSALSAAKSYFSKQVHHHHNHHRQSLPPQHQQQQQQQHHQKTESASDSSAFMALLMGHDDGDDDDADIVVVGSGDAGADISPEVEAAKRREIESIRRALIDSYRTSKLLNNFAIMNYTGFVKIVKKYDKTFPKERRGRYERDIVPSNICDEGLSVDALATRMEVLYSHWFCDKNINEARAQMMIKKSDGLEMDWSQLRLGYRMGMCSILALWVCWDCIWGMVKDHQSTIGGRTAFPIYRACGGLLMLQWCWGVSVWVWSRYRINYIYLFDFNSSIVASPLSIFNEAVDNTLFYLLCALLYYKAGAHDIPWAFPAGVFPFILLLYTSYQLVFPIRVRAPMWETVWQVITAPMSSPTFFHGYVGDIFTSMVKIFQDLVWSFFFVLSGDWLISEDLPASAYHPWLRSTWYTNVLIPLVTLLPLWFRFNQCLRRYVDTRNRFPHLANAFKYALSQTVTLFGAFHPLYMRNQRESQIFQSFWMFAFVASSLYSFCWDLFMVRYV